MEIFFLEWIRTFSWVKKIILNLFLPEKAHFSTKNFKKKILWCILARKTYPNFCRLYGAKMRLGEI